MKKKLTILTVVSAIAALISLGGGLAQAASCTTTLSAGDDIQTAINSATSGDVICLEAGTYSPTAN